MAEKSVKEEWAVMVNVTEPVKDFHKRVPDMAHKVRALYSFVSVSLFSSSIFYLVIKNLNVKRIIAGLDATLAAAKRKL